MTTKAQAKGDAQDVRGAGAPGGKEKEVPNAMDYNPLAIAVAQPTTTTSAGAAFSRSLLLFLGGEVQATLTAGFMFRRPSKLFRPNRRGLLATH